LASAPVNGLTVLETVYGKETLQIRAQHHWHVVRNDCHELLRTARRKLIALTQLKPISPDEATWFAQMAAFPLPAGEGEALQRKLYDEFNIEIPIITWNGQPLVRLSVQGYNTLADIEALLAALSQLLPDKVSLLD
jgi:isopenicillin-N epimerase